jgi:hypothetical protein
MITLRRRSIKGRDWTYQVWPSDLPANAPEPPWQAQHDLPDMLKGPIFTAWLLDEFCPSPEGDGIEEAQISEEEWRRFSSPSPEDDAEQQRANENWGTW